MIRALQSLTRKNLRFGLGLLETQTTASFLPLTTLLEEIDALEALQDITLGRNLTGTLKRCMLAHCLLFPFNRGIVYHFVTGFSTGWAAGDFGSSVGGRKRL